MKFSRRTWLQSALAPAALGWAGNARAAAQTAARHSSFDPWIEIRPDHVRHNVREVSRLVEGRPILAVIKNNAYGMGLLNMARILESEAAVIGMAVVKLSEALELRDAGIAKPVLLMGPFDDADLEAAVMRGVTPMVYTEVATRWTGWRPGGSPRSRCRSAWTPGWAGSASRTGARPD